MKYLLCSLLLCICFNSFGQDPRLFEQRWYLHNLIIDGVDNIPPVNNEIPFVPADFFETGEILTGMCESGGAGNLSYNGTTEFTVIIMAWLQGGCYYNEPFNEMFNQLYVFVYWADNIDFTYTITDNGDSKTLIITNPNNDQAIFNTEILVGINEFEELSFSLYPNPVSNILNINNDLGIDIRDVIITDALGRKVANLAVNSSEDLIFNTEYLKSGIYYLTVISQDSRHTTRKIIKI